MVLVGRKKIGEKAREREGERENEISGVESVPRNLFVETKQVYR